jgi:hypothetical protein
MLGLGHSLVAGSYLDSAYAMASAFDFDGTNDGFLTNTVNAQSPADGTLKPLTTSLSIALWVRLDDVSGSFYEQSGDQRFISCVSNGGWSIGFQNRRFNCHFAINDAALNAGTAQTGFRTARNDNNAARYLFKEDNWHFVVATSDLENPTTSTVTKLYVDGSHDQAGNTSGGGSGPNGENFGAAIGDSDTIKTVNADAGKTITRRYNAVNGAIDLVFGGNPAYNSGSGVTTVNNTLMSGLIGDVAVWEDCVLTGAEVETLYNLHRPIDMSTVQNSKLIGYWRPTNGLKDSVSGTTGTLVDDGAIVTASPSTDVSGYFGYS